MKKIFAIFTIFVSGCVSATLDDDVTIRKQLDVSTELSSLISPIKTVYGNYLPDSFNEKVSLPASTNVDVSDELRNFNDTKYGVSYSLSNVIVKLDCGSSGCWKNVTGFSASLGNVLLTKHTVTSDEAKSSFITVPVTGKFDDIKKVLEAGEVVLNVNVDATLTKDLTLSTKYDVEISLHVTVNVDKSL